MSTTFDESRWDQKAQRIVFRHRAAVKLLSNSVRSVLDIGCGDGLLLSLVKESKGGIEGYGIDWSENAVRAARIKNPDCKFVQGDIVDKPLLFESNTFDAVIALDVLEHIFEPDKLLKEMHRIARREVIVGVPNFSSLPARIQVLFGRVPENNTPRKGHVFWFQYMNFLSMIRSAGFEIQEVEWNYPLSRVPLLSMIMRLLAKLRPSLFALSFVVRAIKR